MMMSKLLRPASNLLSKKLAGKRYKELHEYLCLREALNTKETDAVLKDLEATSKKYKITPNQATEIIYLLQNDPTHYKTYLRESELNELENIFEFEYYDSTAYVPNVSFAKYRSGLWNQYPDLVRFTKPGPERIAGVQTLEEIFLKDGPTGLRALDDQAIRNAIPGFKQKINQHITVLGGLSASISGDHDRSHQKSSPIAARVKRILNDMVEMLQNNPSLTYGRIRAFVALSKGEVSKDSVSGETGVQKVQTQNEGLPTLLRLTQKNEELDIPELVEERNLHTQQGINFQLAPWVNDRLRIFETTSQAGNKAFLWNTVGIVATFEALYYLIQQDTSISYLVALGAIGYYGITHGARLTRKNLVDTLLSADLHRDGKYVDLVIDGKDGLKTVNDLPIEKFRVHEEFKTIEVKGGNFKDLAQIIGAKSTISAQELQESGVVEAGLFATYNENYVFVPSNHRAHNGHIANLFHGKQAAIADNTPKPTA